MTPPRTTPRLLALGDSYTIGEGVTAEESWPAQLANALRRSGIPASDPEIIARTGWTTAELESALDEREPVGPFDLVTVLVGVNDQYRGGEASAYRDAFVRLLGRAIQLAGGDARRVMVVSIPDWGRTPFATGRDARQIGREIDAFNTINRAEAERRGAHWVDVTALSRAAGADMLTSDGLHPAGAMYEQWTACIAPVAAALVSGGVQP